MCWCSLNGTNNKTSFSHFYASYETFSCYSNHHSWAFVMPRCCFFYLLSLLETERVITLLHAGQRGSVVGTSRDSMQGHEEKVTKYGHVCRGGREENKLQLVNVHTRASTEEQTAGGKREEEDTEEEGARRCEPKWAHGFSAFRRHGYRAHRHPHGENEIWPRAKNHNGMRDTDPPLLILLPIHHDHLALGEGQLVWVVGNTVVDGFHSLRPLLLGKTHTDTFFIRCTQKENINKELCVALKQR